MKTEKRNKQLYSLDNNINILGAANHKVESPVGEGQ